MNPLNIIKFISKKNPDKYPMNKIRKIFNRMPQPVEGEGYEDENGMQGKWITRKFDKYFSIFNYVNDVKNGSFEIYHDNILSQKGTYINDKKNGPFEIYYNGRLNEKGVYKNDHKIGFVDLYVNDDYHNTNTRFASITFGDDNETRNGPYIYYSYNEDNQPHEKGIYVNGKKNGPFESYLRGKLYMKGTYINDKKEGPYEIYSQYTKYNDDIGDFEIEKTNYIEEKGTYVNNKKEGPFICYKPNGKIYEKGININDKPHYDEPHND